MCSPNAVWPYITCRFSDVQKLPPINRNTAQNTAVYIDSMVFQVTVYAIVGYFLIQS